MADNINLRAFVRLDGQNRVIAGSLIMRKKQPKVGKWMEIQPGLCCTTTTTTSTSSTTTTTTTL